MVAFTYVYYASALLSRPFSRKKTALIFAGVGVFCWSWNVIGSIQSDFYMFGAYTAYALGMILIYKKSWRNAIYFALIYYFSLGYVTRIMGWIYQAVDGQYYMMNGHSYWNKPWIYLATTGVMIAIVYFVRPQVHKIADYEIEMTEFLHIMVITLPLAYFCYSLTLLSAPFDHLPLSGILLRAIISIGAMEAMLGLIINRKQQQELADLRFMMQRQQEEYQRHLVKAESSELVMQKFHDLQKYLRLIQDTCNGAQLEKYQADLKATVDAYDSVYETGNSTLDSILSEASRLCRNENIQLICIADGALINFMDPVDICTIFGNALDNAIESARALTHSEKKIIHLKICQEKCLLLIRFENYYEHAPRWQDGQLVTSKSEKTGHGYGVKSIQYAVKKYAGNVRITTENGKFSLTALLHRDDLSQTNQRKPAYEQRANI